jgi:hypothetical protein
MEIVYVVTVRQLVLLYMGVILFPDSALTLALCRADYSALGGPPATPAGGVAAACPAGLARRDVGKRSCSA